MSRKATVNPNKRWNYSKMVQAARANDPGHGAYKQKRGTKNGKHK